MPSPSRPTGATADARPKIIRRTLGHPADDDAGSSNHDETTLRLAFLGCEVLPPYGPYDHTAEMFADLIAAAYSVALDRSSSNPDSPQTNNAGRKDLVLEVYGVSQQPTAKDTTESESESNGSPPAPTPPQLARYPSETDLGSFDGVILPGSVSSAYQTDLPWIGSLSDWIQDELVRRAVPTLGVCFGHQLYAHSFSRRLGGGGTAVRCPAGPQAGQRTTALTLPGEAFLGVARRGDGKSGTGGCSAGSTGSLDLLYTHGDMVESLPPSRGVSLGGNEEVPIQAALYFSSPVGPGEIESAILRQTTGTITGDSSSNSDGDGDAGPGVMAVTFQAHPEFTGNDDDGGGNNSRGDDTYRRILELMRDRGDVSDDACAIALEKLEANRGAVRKQSVDAMVAAGRLLGWFPC